MSVPLPLSPGLHLGPYEILSALGAGGMGEVYRARDTRLDRDVAIKSLPAAFTADPDRVARLRREAKTLAALSHPNIGTIHGLEETNGVSALVMELVDGEDLSDRIERGPVAIDEALPIAAQIASALEAAHDLGIIHRDLKPANIKVRPDGAVKVLDFGLAKTVDAVAAVNGGAHAPTITTRAMTRVVERDAGYRVSDACRCGRTSVRVVRPIGPRERQAWRTGDHDVVSALALARRLSSTRRVTAV